MQKKKSGRRNGRFFLGWLIVSFFLGACQPAQQPPTHEVYIWQRVWTPAVPEAIDKSRPFFQTYIVLAGEIAWTADGPTFAKAQVNYAALRKANVKIGLALRIGPYRGPFLTNDKASDFVRQKVQSILSETRTERITPTELQIDFDCAQAKLEGYRVWLETIRATTGKVPVTITVLPSWLGEKDFVKLAGSADGLILQVHSVQMPIISGQAPKIFDETSAQNWIRQAGKLGFPFRVALPTYTNQIITNSDGKIIRITSEDSPALLPSNVTFHFARAEAPAVAALIETTQRLATQNFHGWLWYRLPLTTDRSNWRWETLQAVIEQKPLQSELIVHEKSGDLTLENTGNLDAPFPDSVSANWTNSRLAAADALPGWKLTRESNQISFHANSQLQEDRLPPGGKVAIGWLRLDSPENIHVQIP